MKEGHDEANLQQPFPFFAFLFEEHHTHWRYGCEPREVSGVFCQVGWYAQLGACLFNEIHEF